MIHTTTNALEKLPDLTIYQRYSERVYESGLR